MIKYAGLICPAFVFTPLNCGYILHKSGKAQHVGD